MRRLPIRWRLTLWFTAFLAAILIMFGGAVFLELRDRLYAGFDDQLLDQAALVLANVDVQDGSPTFVTERAGESSSEYFLRLIAVDGQVLVDTGESYGGVPPLGAAIASALAGQTTFATITVPGHVDDTTLRTDEDRGEQHAPHEEHLRIVTEPIRFGATQSIVGALQVGLDRDDVDEPLYQLLRVFALVSPLVLLVAAGGGYLLARQALAPVATITNLAARIGSQALDARLRLDLPDDELGRLATTFDAMLARIEEAFERQRHFTADAAHELRTPLSLMRTQVDVALARRRSAAEYREALQALDGDLQRMTGLVTTLLSLARADTGRLVAERRPLDLAETVMLILEQYAPVADEAGIALEAHTEPTLLEADEDLLFQVLVNLMDNALAHTPRSGTITVGCQSAAGDARLWVSDTGSGIPLADQGRVFDRFYRVDAGRARSSGGTGLGLAICKAIAVAHGGSIAVTSLDRQGTRVELVLPTRMDR